MASFNGGVNMLPEECSSSSHQDPNWTKEENKLFELLLIKYPSECPTRYESIARCLSSKSADQVRVHCEALFAHVHAIEDDLVPMPNYPDDEVGSTMNENNNNRSSSANKNALLEPVGRREKKRRNPECNWTEEEHGEFLMGLKAKGRGDWRGISRSYVKTKTSAQVASHAQKYFLRQSEQKKKKRKSIHDTRLHEPPTQQPNSKMVVSEVQQHGDRTQGPEQERVNQVASYSQHVDDSQDANHPQSQEQQHLQDANHAQSQEQHHQPDQQSCYDLFESIGQEVDHEQWETLQQLQQIDELTSDDWLHDDLLQAQDGMHHDHLTPTMYDQSMQTNEVNQSQDVQEAQMIQQTSNKDDQLIARMTLAEVNQGQSAQEWQMIQLNTNRDHDQLVSNTTSIEVNQGQVEQQEQNTNDHDGYRSQPRSRCRRK